MPNTAQSDINEHCASGSVTVNNAHNRLYRLICFPVRIQWSATNLCIDLNAGFAWFGRFMEAAEGEDGGQIGVVFVTIALCQIRLA